jgi:membrane-bound lytic murein transglycosylase MltF
MKVGNIRKVNANIHAGIKYHHMLINRYFSGASFNALNRTLFTFAAYNAGPARIQKIRRIAKERGLNPNIWFDNVELIVAEKIGAETTNYVANIYKYYVAYKLFEEIKVEKYKAKEVLKGLSQ